MAKHRQYAVLIFAALGTVLMQFQNCAPAQEGLIADGEVRIVDRWQQSKLEFQATSYYVDENVDAVNIDGFCDSEEVNWEISRVASDGSVHLVDSGISSCNSGSFSVASNAHHTLNNCEEVAEVLASLPDASLQAKTQVRIQCF